MEFHTEQVMAESSSDQESMREELEQYLEEMRTKKTDEGAPMVHYPKNFDRVAGAMNRSDLHADGETGEAPWSKYLLAEATLRRDGMTRC